MSKNLLPFFRKNTNVKVVGIGGAGGNALDVFISKNLSDIETIAINADIAGLERSKASNHLLFAHDGKGTCRSPERGKRLAKRSQLAIAFALRGAEVVFILAGMGGGTGTGASPVVAEIARSVGAKTIAIVSMPFSFEGKMVMQLAREGIAALEMHTDVLIVLYNEKLETRYPNASLFEWLQSLDRSMGNIIESLLGETAFVV